MNRLIQLFSAAFLFLVLMFFTSDIQAQQCDENFTYINLNQYVENEYGPDLISVWACKQIKDTKVEQKIYFNIRNLTENTIYISFNGTIYTDGGTEEKLDYDSLFKTLTPRSEINGYGSIVDDDLWLKLTKIHSSKEDKVADVTFELFNVTKMVNGKEVAVLPKGGLKKTPNIDSLIQGNLQKKEPIPPDTSNLIIPTPGDSSNIAKNGGITEVKDTSINNPPQQKSNRQKKKEAKDEKKRQEKELAEKKAEEDKLKKEQEKKAQTLNNNGIANGSGQTSSSGTLSGNNGDTLSGGLTAPDTTNNNKKIDTTHVQTINYAEKGPTDEDIKKAKGQVIEKIKQLEINFSTLSKKDLSVVSWQNTIDNTVRMFIDEEQRIQISTLHRKSVTTFKIRVYCQRLRTVLPYDSASVENANIYFVTDFKPNANGQWEALTVFTQTFTGFRENKPVYSDVTEKTIRVILDYKPLYADGVQKGNWELLLGDIKVLSTKAL